jgi:HEPN domain-containing protein
MDKSLVTENPEELYAAAEMDIKTVDSLLTKPKYPEDQMYNVICFHATQAVEKFLKGYIINKGKTVEKIHNLDILQKTAMKIDNSFSEILDDCLLLNEYGPQIKYSTRNQVTKQDMDKIIKSLESICNFPPIKAMRDKFSKEHNYEIVGEIMTKRVT